MAKCMNKVHILKKWESVVGVAATATQTKRNIHSECELHLHSVCTLSSSDASYDAVKA